MQKVTILDCFPSAKFGQMSAFLKLQIICNNLKLGEMHGKATGVAKYSPEALKMFYSKIKKEVKKGNKKEWFYTIISECLSKVKIYGLDKGDYHLTEINTIHDLKERRAELNGRKHS